MRFILTLLLIGLLIEARSQTPCTFGQGTVPDELFRKRLKDTEAGFKYGGPYTMFNRSKDDWSFDYIRGEVIKRITAGLPVGDIVDLPFFALVYKNILDHAGQPEPAYCPEDSKDCDHPKWVKSNALVFYIGLKDSISITGLHYMVPMSIPERKNYFFRAQTGLTNLNFSVVSCWGGPYCGIIRQRAMHLISYLQAYDLLKSYGEHWGQTISPDYITGDDRNKGTCSPRNKLRRLARNVFNESDAVINSPSGWKRNHGIICASAIGMAAIVLNDAGTELESIPYIGNFLWLNGLIGLLKDGVIPQPDYSPIKWLDRAVGTPGGNDGVLGDGEDGLYDNFFVGDHWFLSPDVPQTNPEGTAGYAEGTGYAIDLMTAFLPFIRAADNALPRWNSKNPLAGQNKYINILYWIKNISDAGGILPQYDNAAGPQNFLGILGHDSFPSFPQNIPDLTKNVDLRGDYLLALGNEPKQQPSSLINLISGDLILNNYAPKNRNHYFHMLCEEGFSVDNEFGLSAELPGGIYTGSHEEEDYGSFTLSVNSNWLAVDPPYQGWTDVTETNKFEHHNIIRFLGTTGYINQTHVRLSLTPKLNGFELSYMQFGTSSGAPSILGYITRNVKAYNDTSDATMYYMVTDYLHSNNSTIDRIEWQLNGNGYIGSNTYSYEAGGKERVSIWGTENAGWRLMHHAAFLSGDTLTPFQSEEIQSHVGTQLHFTQHKKNTLVQSFLLPLAANELPPTVARIESDTHVVSIINFVIRIDTINAKFGKMESGLDSLVADTVSHFHYARFNGNISDSLANPFHLSHQGGDMLKLNAQKAFVKHHSFAWAGKGYKYCPPTYANIRHIELDGGSYLSFRDTDYVRSTIAVNLSWALTKRHTYQVSIKALSTPTNSDTIAFRLPDVSRGIDMTAVSDSINLFGRYDSLTQMYYLRIPEGEQNFRFEELLKCNDCYFPPKWMNIVEPFDANDGQIHNLGHKLTIVRDTGSLYVSNGTRVFICDGAYLYNKDSLILSGPCGTVKGKTACEGVELLVKSKSNSSIFIRNGSALILEDSSYTYIKNNGGIYVASGGSLIIKSGAFVQVGDSGRCGYGEIVAEAGAYVYIEPGAHVEFRKVKGDTADRNLIHFALRGGTTIMGVQSPMDSILDADTVLQIGTTPIAICDLDSLNPILNKEWGYANFMPPAAIFVARQDTLCPGEPFHVKMNRILNDAYAEVKVCRMDSVWRYSVAQDLWFWQDTCVEDSIMIDSVPPDPVCKPPRILGEDWSYWGSIGQRYRITMNVWNDCGLLDDTVAYIYFADSPHFDIWAPDSACPGEGTVFITTSGGLTGVHYTWEITEFPDTNSLEVFIGKPAETYTVSSFGNISDTTYFPTYNFRGGRKYIISLSVTNDCGSFTATRTVRIPLSAYIRIKKATTFANPVGPSAFELEGVISGASSFTWNPTTYLVSPTSLSTVSLPSNPIQYVLDASDGTCHDYDTVSVMHNLVTFAGEERTMCLGDSVMLGTDFEGAMWLGLLNYMPNSSTLESFYNRKIQAGIKFHKHFTRFLINRHATYNTSPHPYYDFASIDATRAKIQSTEWYLRYFKAFTDHQSYNSSYTTTFNPFRVSLDADNPLQAEVDSFYFIYERAQVEAVLNDYQTYFNLGDTSNAETTWEYKNKDSLNWIPFDGTNGHANWIDFYNMWDNPPVTRDYRFTVIDNDLSVVEYDSVRIWVDTAIQASYYPAYQIDSTIYFYNNTAGTIATTTYSWNFGDGSALSTIKHPQHTYPAFDSSYIVCLTVTNGCGTTTLCDTINVDSNGLMGLFSKRDADEIVKNFIIQKEKEQRPPSQNNSLSANRPNPFSDQTIVEYNLNIGYREASLRITTPLGQVLNQYKLTQPQGLVVVDGTGMQVGLYYYSLIVDGTIVDSKVMMVKQ